MRREIMEFNSLAEKQILYEVDLLMGLAKTASPPAGPYPGVASADAGRHNQKNHNPEFRKQLRRFHLDCATLFFIMANSDCSLIIAGDGAPTPFSSVALICPCPTRSRKSCLPTIRQDEAADAELDKASLAKTGDESR